MSASGEEGGFLSRWSRRKVQAGGAPAGPQSPVAADLAPVVQAAPPLPLATPPQPEPEGQVPAPVAAPLPTLDDVALLTRESDFSRFVAPGVDNGVRNAAMKKLFTDPHFNVMDGLDTYIDDYGKPDPIPESMLRMMRQSQFLGLFDDDKKEAPDASDPELPAASATPVADTAATAEPEDLAHEDTDLRLQQDDAAGRPRPAQGPGA